MIRFESEFESRLRLTQSNIQWSDSLHIESKYSQWNESVIHVYW